MVTYYSGPIADMFAAVGKDLVGWARLGRQRRSDAAVQGLDTTFDTASHRKLMSWLGSLTMCASGSCV